MEAQRVRRGHRDYQSVAGAEARSKSSMATRTATNAQYAMSGFAMIVLPLRYDRVSVGSVALWQSAVSGAAKRPQCSACVASPVLVKGASVSVTIREKLRPLHVSLLIQRGEAQDMASAGCARKVQLKMGCLCYGATTATI